MIIREIDVKAHESADLAHWFEMRLERLATWLPPCRKVPLARFQQMLSEGKEIWRRRAWIVELPGQATPVGYAEMVLNPNDQGLCSASVFVLPDFRRRKIGSALLAILKTAAKAEGRNQISNNSQGIPTDPARPFFATFGVKPIMSGFQSGAFLTDAIEKLKASELPPRPLLHSSLVNRHLSEEEFESLVALGATDLIPDKIPQDLSPYEHYLQQDKRWEQQGWAQRHMMIFRQTSDNSIIAAAAVLTGDWPTAMNHIILPTTVTDPATHLAIVETLLTGIHNSLPSVTQVFTRPSPLLPIFEQFGFGPFHELNTWRIDL